MPLPSRPVLVCFACALALAAAPALATGKFDGQSWWKHVQVLSDDKFEGRETGSPGERAAQEYVIAQLKALKVEAAGSDGYRQPVHLQSHSIDESGSSMELVRGGQAVPLTLGKEAFFSTRIQLAPAVDAPLVFVGYGLQIPEAGVDDFAGLDLKGKIAVTFAGSPASLPSALAAHFQSLQERWKALQAAGAIGVLGIPNPASMDIPWARMSVNRTHPSMVLAAPEFDDTRGAQFWATFNPEFADLLFEGTGHTFAELAALGKDRAPMPRFPLTASLRAKATTSVQAVESSNLAALIRGTDPKLKDETVVLSAHLDHIGIGAPINGDKIYNGAMDNASGSAVLLELARSLRKEKLKRSVLLVWVTGEEKGLLGSRLFAAYPTVPAAGMVANLNTDMFLPIVPLHVLTVYGLAESDLGDRVTAVAKGQGLAVQPDPEPLRNSFIRSDQYNFIKEGVPALAMKVGFLPGSPEAKQFKDWLTANYHAPSDDAAQTIDLKAAGGFVEVMHRLAVQVANDPKRPAWKTESFFRRFVKGS